MYVAVNTDITKAATEIICVRVIEVVLNSGVKEWPTW